MNDENPPVTDTPWIKRASTRRSLLAGVAAIVAAASAMSALVADGSFSLADQFSAVGLAFGIVYAFISESATSAARTSVENLHDAVVPKVAEVKADVEAVKAEVLPASRPPHDSLPRREGEG